MGSFELFCHWRIVFYGRVAHSRVRTPVRIICGELDVSFSIGLSEAKVRHERIPFRS